MALNLAHAFGKPGLTDVFGSAMRFMFSRALHHCCAACGLPVDSDDQGGICSRCMENISLHSPSDLPHWIEIDAVTSLGIYEGTTAKLLIRFKKGHDPSAGKTLCYCMHDLFDSFVKHIGATVPLAAAQIVLTWPPGSRRPAISRGYDHMQKISHRLADMCGVASVQARPLFRRNNQLQQKTLSKAERILNARTLFSIQTSVLAQMPKQAIYIVLDDVSTSGATLENCRRLLMEQGCAHVYAVCLLRD